MKIYDWWYYLRCLLFKRYNIVKIKTLPPTYSDPGEVLLHVAFQVLCNYIEKEDPFEWFDVSQNPEKWDKIRNLYNWWKIERPARKEIGLPPELEDHEPFNEIPYCGDVPCDEKDADCFEIVPKTDIESLKYFDYLDEWTKQEKEWEKEDAEKLIELCSIRGDLWI